MRNIYLFILFALSISTYSQTNVDSIFNIAITQSRSGNYQKAIVEASNALKADSMRADILVFVANVYSWKNSNDTALLQLNKARKLKYLNDDFYESALNILLRANKNDSLLSLCDEAEKFGYKDTNNLIIKRLTALENKKEFQSIISILSKEENKKLLDNQKFNDIYLRAKENLRTNIFAIDYTLDLFQKVTAHHFVAASYTNKYKSYSTTFGLNYANRYKKENIQAEFTIYKTLISKNYWYLNYGYAFGNELFAKHRSGLEYYFKLAPKWEASLGGRYLFYPNSAIKDIWIATGNIGVYLKNSWFTLRPFYVIQSDNKSLSFSTKYRLYEDNPQNFWGIEFGFGNSPDDIYTSTQGSFNQLMSYRIKMEKNSTLSSRSQLFVAAGLVFEEFYVNSIIEKRNRFIIDLGYRFKF